MPPDGAITVHETAGGWTADVTVAGRGRATRHIVHVSRDEHQRLTGGAASPEALVRASFEFLLEREPGESILREFEIGVISRYFPEYEAVVAERLRSTDAPT